MNNKSNQTREEFEESKSSDIKTAVEKAREIREKVRLLEENITDREEKIKNYQTVFQELQEELVKIQAILYAKGTI